jgi:multidrug efflux pump subunit AcrA (membrane-fusion protein)
MSNNRPPLPVIILLFLVLLGAGAYFLWPKFAPAATNGALTASGTVETAEISVAPELSGKVAEVNVNEGDTVKAGDVLFRLDDSLLKAQKDVAAANLTTAKAAALTSEAAVAAAQAQYNINLNAAMVQEKPIRTMDWAKGQPGEFTLPLWYYDQAEQITAAQSEVDAAQAALTDAHAKQTSVLARAASADFVKAETDLAAAQARYQVANNLYNRVRNGKNIDEITRRQEFLLARDAYLLSKDVTPKWANVSNLSQDLRDAAQTIYDDAKSNLKDAQQAYEDAVTTQGAKDVLKARAQTSIAEERYYTALDYVRILQTGSEAQTVTASMKVLEQAKAAAAQTGTAISQAEANLALIEAQMAKLTVTAPVDGVILTRNVEPGEVVNPGSAVFSLGRLSDLTITVYIPEDRYGEVSLGQTAHVTVDSFAGVTFNATVVHIAGQAEFTPRNVQTVEGRKSTVFAIKLSVDNSNNQLKPGMPADVTFVK